MDITLKELFYFKFIIDEVLEQDWSEKTELELRQRKNLIEKELKERCEK